MHIQRHTHISTHVQSAHKRNCDNQAKEPGWERRKEGFVRDLAQKTKCQKTPIFTDLKNRFEHIELPAKLLDYFLRSNKSNINQWSEKVRMQLSADKTKIICFHETTRARNARKRPRKVHGRTLWPAPFHILSIYPHKAHHVMYPHSYKR